MGTLTIKSPDRALGGKEPIQIISGWINISVWWLGSHLQCRNSKFILRLNSDGARQSILI